MSKFAIFSDLHLDPWTAFANIDNRGLNTRLVQCAETLHFILSEAERLKCDAALFCGDWYHRKTVAIETLDVCISTLKKTSIPLIVIAGNHDSADKLSRLNSIKTLHGRARILDIGNDAKSVNIAGHKITGMPYIGQDFDKYLKAQLDGDIPDILMLHAPVADALMGSDFITHEGTGFDKQEVCGGIPLTLVGHFHQPQLYKWMGPDDYEAYIPAQDNDIYELEHGGTVLIPGAPLQHNIGDRDCARGFWIYDGESLTFRDSNAPRFLVLTPEEVLELSPKELNGNYITIQAPDRLSADKALNSIKDAKGIVTTVVAPESKKSDERIKFGDKADYKANLKSYCEQMGEKSLDVQELGVKLIEEARK